MSRYEVEVNGRNITTPPRDRRRASPLSRDRGDRTTGYLTSNGGGCYAARRLFVLGRRTHRCELGQSFSRSSRGFTQVEMLPRILAREDRRFPRIMHPALRLEGIGG